MRLKIGFLIPYSSIYPDLPNDIIHGFYAALPKPQLESNLFEFVPEYVGQGGAKMVTAAVQKLLYFSNADLISGLISYKAMPAVIAELEKRGKLGFFMDMGELIPYNQHISDSVFLNSYQLWQSEYALGYWAHKEFADKGTVLMSLYDAGYHLQSSFRQGAISAGSKEMDFTVLHGDPAQSQVKENIHIFFKKAYEKFPSYIHALFCGSEAVEFYREFAASGLNGKVPLIVSAHMASEEILDQLSGLSLEIYSASLYNYASEDAANKKFKRDFESLTGRKANLFALLGYEMGVAIQELIPYLQKRDYKTVSALLKAERLQTPRGERSFYLDSDYSLPQIDIEKITINDGKISRIVVSQGRALKYNDLVYDEIHRENISGWQNPYLCV
ncbi:ABC transporter substrate-binding protein [Pedobacter nyackensis]|uniref:ABC transporter substrate-binding protein n=1 Tax=Pedobacter nyackensis TaxID=475255 RepID=UPI002931BAE3|nr:ABC transporter substrate-binding protein [Pedobacter nyackensis]